MSALDHGSVKGHLRTLLRLEGLTIFVASLSAYIHAGYPWKTFFILFLFPDISFMGYLFGKTPGCITYNTFHSYTFPLVLGLISWHFLFSGIQCFILIWLAHIGFDRFLGYGLKYPQGARYTHLGLINLGRKPHKKIK